MTKTAMSHRLQGEIFFLTIFFSSSKEGHNDTKMREKTKIMREMFLNGRHRNNKSNGNKKGKLK
jgi:transcriptional antiterminator